MQPRTAKIELEGESFTLREHTAGEDLEVLQASLTWDPVSGRPRPDLRKLNVKSLHSSLVAWSLKDGEGKPLPIDEEAVRRLPRHVFYALMAKVGELNGLTPQEARAFLPA